LKINGLIAERRTLPVSSGGRVAVGTDIGKTSRQYLEKNPDRFGQILFAKRPPLQQSCAKVRRGK
jgi:hypothetical protein